MLVNASIKDEIIKVRDELFADSLLTPKAIIQKYMDIAFAGISGFMEFRLEELVARDIFSKIIRELRGSIKGTRINIHDLRNLALYESISHIVAVGHDGGVSTIGSVKKYVDVLFFHQLFRSAIGVVYNLLEFDQNYVKMSATNLF